MSPEHGADDGRQRFYRRALADSAGPLDGVRVLDLGRVWSAPQACAILGDLGADVVKLELPHGRDGEVPPELPGTGLSWFRESANRNKRSVGVDLRTEAGRDDALRLVVHADVVVENFLPGTLDSWGVGYEACRSAREDIVFVSVSGWGQYGPRSRFPAYDPVVQAASGWMSLNGAVDGEPVRAPTFLADELGAVHAVIGTLAALRHRDRTGEGQHVDVAMLDALLASSSGLPALAAAGAPPPRSGNETDFVAPSNVYRCQDGHLYVSIAMNRHWRVFAELIGRPELQREPGFATNSERLANRDTLNALVAGWCAGRSATAAQGLLQDAGLVAAVVQTFEAVVADSHLAERDMLQPVTLHNGRTTRLTGVASKFSRTPTRVWRGAPEAGGDKVTDVLAGWAGPGTASGRT